MAAGIANMANDMADSNDFLRRMSRHLIIPNSLSKQTPDELSFPDERDFAFVRYFETLSSLTAESIYVFDIQDKQFCYIKPCNLFLCGYSVEEALELGEDFFAKILYTKDLKVWTNIHEIVLQYLKNYKEKWDEIDFFSCTFRLQRKYSFRHKPVLQMVFKRIKPVWEDNELRYLFCSLGSSTSREVGNLLMHNNDGTIYEPHRDSFREWKRKETEALTERESATLILAQQAKSVKEIANDLDKAYDTIKNQLKPIFEKLNVRSIAEAINIASNYRMIYISKQDTKANIQPPVETPQKRSRVLINDEMMQRIQQYLDKGLKIREIAKIIGISESAIRYLKKKGKLKGE
jgi:DNA-binding NarL/FixJ family response regulator